MKNLSCAMSLCVILCLAFGVVLSSNVAFASCKKTNASCYQAKYTWAKDTWAKDTYCQAHYDCGKEICEDRDGDGIKETRVVLTRFFDGQYIYFEEVDDKHCDR